MAEFTVSESGQEGARKLVVSYDFGANLAEAVEKFGEDVVFSGFVADGKVSVQAVARGKMKKNKEDGSAYSDAEILEAVAAYKPGVKSDRGSADPFAKLEKVVGKLNETQKAELLAKLQALL
jgi:hypothetical protein